MRRYRLLFLVIICALSVSQVNAQLGDVQVRVEGVGVSPDTINGLQAMVPFGSRVKMVWSSQAEVQQRSATLGFVLYSPDNPGMSVEWSKPSGVNDSIFEALNSWAGTSIWTLGGPLVLTDIDDVFPEQFLFAGVALFGGFQSDTLLDVFMGELVFDDTGVVCLDSAFYPFSGGVDWLMLPTGPPTWGGAPVGYPDGGFCITVYDPGCCTTPGDANSDATVNIADLDFIISRIFFSGPAPSCDNEADINGDQDVNIADAAFLIARIFRGGPAPHCWWQTDPSDSLDYTFFGLPDSLTISPCGSFADSFLVQVVEPPQTTGSLPEYSIVNTSAGVTAFFSGPNSDSLHVSGSVNSTSDEFVIIRAASTAFPGLIQTDKIILITCQ